MVQIPSSELIIAQLIKKNLTFIGTRSFITVFTKTILNTHPHLRPILILHVHERLLSQAVSSIEVLN
jgi:hypothetical protein